jgi:arsenite-transporting ATPase
VVANQVIGAELATNAFFRRRRAMQQKYLVEIDRRFGVPVLEIPLLGEEPRGIERLERIAEAALGTATAPAAVGMAFGGPGTGGGPPWSGCGPGSGAGCC